MDLYAELIFNNPGITAKGVSEKCDLCLWSAYKHLKRVEERYKCIRRTKDNELEVFLLEKKKSSREPFRYSYRKIDAVPMCF